MQRTGGELELIRDAGQACALLTEAAGLIREDPLRRGSTLRFGGAGQLVVTGDMHGNLANFAKLRKYCSLDRNPARFVVLHELIHAEISPASPLDLSIDLLLAAVQWKCQHPDNVFFLQSNHELAQLRNQEITKAGRSVLYDFEQGVAHRFGASGAGKVLGAINDYIAALPLAVRTASGVFVCHSLPDPLLIPTFDVDLFDREPTEADLAPGGHGYALVWGRFHSSQSVATFAARVGAEHFVVGHTPQDTGYRVTGQMIILSSEHNHGTFLPIDLARAYTTAQLEASIRKFVSVE